MRRWRGGADRQTWNDDDGIVAESGFDAEGFDVSAEDYGLQEGTDGIGDSGNTGWRVGCNDIVIGCTLKNDDVSSSGSSGDGEG